MILSMKYRITGSTTDIIIKILILTWSWIMRSRSVGWVGSRQDQNKIVRRVISRKQLQRLNSTNHIETRAVFSLYRAFNMFKILKQFMEKWMSYVTIYKIMFYLQHRVPRWMKTNHTNVGLRKLCMSLYVHISIHPQRTSTKIVSAFQWCIDCKSK